MHDTNNVAVVPWLARLLVRANGDIGHALFLAERQGAPTMAIRILKAAVPAGTLSDQHWAGELADLMRATTTTFLQGLGGRSAFAALLDQAVITRAPLGGRVGASTAGAVGGTTPEGRAAIVSTMTITGDNLTAENADVLVVLSREVFDDMSASSQAFLARQLRRSICKVLDAGFQTRLIDSSVPTFTSAGPGASDMREDLRQMLDAVNNGQGRLCWVASKEAANAVAVMQGATGTTRPEGLSEFMNLPFAVSPAMSAGDLMLLDGDQVLADIDIIGVDVAREAALQMSNAPTADVVAPTPVALLSLWQTNAVGVKMSCRFGAARGTNSALCLMTGVNWGAPES